MVPVVFTEGRCICRTVEILDFHLTLPTPAECPVTTSREGLLSSYSQFFLHTYCGVAWYGV